MMKVHYRKKKRKKNKKKREYKPIILSILLYRNHSIGKK
jgi:hypothetical protein